MHPKVFKFEEVLLKRYESSLFLDSPVLCGDLFFSFYHLFLLFLHFSEWVQGVLDITLVRYLLNLLQALLFQFLQNQKNDIVYHSLQNQWGIHGPLDSHSRLRLISRYLFLFSKLLQHTSLQRNHNEGDAVSNHRRLHCLLNRLLRRR